MQRGQVHTLEAIVAGLLLLTSVVFALQMTAVTPLSASTSNQHIENQQQAAAEGVLSMSKESGALQRSLLYYNVSGDPEPQFHDAAELERYYQGPMPTEFGEKLERAFGDRGIAYNVNVHWMDGSSLQTQPVVDQGVPSDNAVSATRTVVLTDDMRIRDGNMDETVPISGTDDFYVDPAPESTGGYYNTVRVEVVVWRI